MEFNEKNLWRTFKYAGVAAFLLWVVATGTLAYVLMHFVTKLW